MALVKEERDSFEQSVQYLNDEKQSLMTERDELVEKLKELNSSDGAGDMIDNLKDRIVKLESESQCLVKQIAEKDSELSDIHVRNKNTLTFLIYSYIIHSFILISFIK